MSAPVRVLLVDDHAVMRAGFRMILEAQNDISVVGEAGTGAEAVDAASALHPDVICMDVQMPDMDGLEATRRIVSDPQVDAAVVIVTTFDRDDYLFQALRAGASGFLLKTTAAAALVAAVRAAASHAGNLITPELAHQMAGEQPADAAGALVDAEAIAQLGLTEREQEVLVLLCQAESNAGIAEKLTLSESTVKTHVSSLMAKLGCSSRLQVALTAFERGLATPPHP